MRTQSCPDEHPSFRQSGTQPGPLRLSPQEYPSGQLRGSFREHGVAQNWSIQSNPSLQACSGAAGFASHRSPISRGPVGRHLRTTGPGGLPDTTRQTLPGKQWLSSSHSSGRHSKRRVARLTVQACLDGQSLDVRQLPQSKTPPSNRQFIASEGRGPVPPSRWRAVSASATSPAVGAVGECSPGTAPSGKFASLSWRDDIRGLSVENNGGEPDEDWLDAISGARIGPVGSAVGPPWLVTGTDEMRFSASRGEHHQYASARVMPSVARAFQPRAFRGRNAGVPRRLEQ
jgi:hypothetical protein